MEYFRSLLGAPPAKALALPSLGAAKALPIVPYKALRAVPKFETAFTAPLAKPAMPIIPKASKPHAKAKAMSKHLAASLLVQELAKGRLPWIPPVPKSS